MMGDSKIVGQLTWPLVVLGVGLGLVWAPEWVLAALQWDRCALQDGQWWRLWTGHAVHFSATHAMSDLVPLAFLVAWAQARWGSAKLLLALCLSAAAVSLGLLWLVPDMQQYRGASVWVTFLGVALGLQAGWQRPEWRWALLGVALLAAAKTLADIYGGSGLASNLPPGVDVAWEAHLLGAALALGAAATSIKFRRLS